jgi:adenylate cyclase
MIRPTLAQVMLGATLAAVAIIGLAFAALLAHSRASLLATSEALRLAAAQRIEAQVAVALGRAEQVLSDIERALRFGALELDDGRSLEAYLATELLDSESLEEVTFTRARLSGHAPDGSALFELGGRCQLSLSRDAAGQLIARRIEVTIDGVDASERVHAPGATFDAALWAPLRGAVDPTLHPTFSVITARDNLGRTLWSDLHYSELVRQPAAARVVLSVQKALLDEQDRFLGVVRVGFLTDDLDAIVQTSRAALPDDPHRVALLAVSSNPGSPARLVARVDPRDRVVELEQELRIVSDHPPPEIAALLESPLVNDLDPEQPSGGGLLDVGGQRYWATLRALSIASGGTAGWLVAVLVPEAYYTRELASYGRVLLGLFGVTLALVLVIGVVTLRVVRRDLKQLGSISARMRRFDFTPGGARSALRDTDDVLQGLERAKTVSRAMGRYVPIGIVRHLYESNREPQLGGELRELSVMFSDIEGFTALSERLSPDALALHLGAYLEVMTGAIEAAGGTIDKYIGDAVMALWNAPGPLERHAKHACRAVLQCQRALARLYQSPSWQGLPPLVTRFGLHTARVMVGHFGAPSRLSYTALGDGVNLAARLEPLCKQYAVQVLVSEAIVAAAGDDFVFRRVDRVTVRGKSEAVEVYELVGARS